METNIVIKLSVLLNDVDAGSVHVSRFYKRVSIVVGTSSMRSENDSLTESCL